MLKGIYAIRNRFKGELLFMAANYTTPLVGFYVSAIAAAFVSPKDMGSIQAALLLPPYLSMLHLGVFNGLARNLAYYFGKGDRETGLRMVNASAFIARINSWIGFCAGAGLLAWLLLKGGTSRVTICAGIAVLATLVCAPLILHISTTNRSGQHFKVFGRVVLIANSLRVVYSSLPIVIGWIGYVIALAIQPLVRFSLLKATEPYPATKNFAWQDVKELIHVGLPIMIVGYIGSLLMVADQSLIAIYLPKEQLGYYVLSRLLMQAMIILPATLSILISPKVAARYGATGQAGSLRRYFWMLLGLHLVFLGPICLVAYFAVEPVVHALLPNYVPGLGAAKITILTCLTFVGKGAFIITSTLRKNILIITLHGIGFGLMWLAGILIFRFGNPSIEDIAWLRFYISAGLAGAMLVYGFFMTRSEKNNNAHI